MKTITEAFEGKESSLFKAYEKAATTETRVTAIQSERASLLKEILYIINSEREGTKFHPFTGRALAIKLSHIKTPDLYFVLSQGKDYKNRHGSFSKYVFGSIKIRK